MRGRPAAIALGLGIVATSLFGCDEASAPAELAASGDDLARVPPGGTPEPRTKPSARPARLSAAGPTMHATASPSITATAERTITPDIPLPLATFASEDLLPVAVPVGTAAAELVASISQPGIDPRVEKTFYVRADELSAIEDVYPAHSVEPYWAGGRNRRPVEGRA